MKPPALQQVVKVRRDYNTWVADETLEDYALRFTPRSYRKWPPLRVANTAFGAASFLVLEAIGATLLVNYGFTNAALAIVLSGLIIFLAGLPISIYAARYGLDMDLLTRGAGFGYLGSTITSLVYASFTFIFFALEAAIMAYALELGFGIPPVWGYLLCALVVIPIVIHGVRVISRLQTMTQSIWLVMWLLPFAFLLFQNPQALLGLMSYSGGDGNGGHFDVYLLAAAMAVALALITQMGEQADYLRFMPEHTPENHRRWWAAVLIGGPGWVVIGVIKMLGGALLAYLVISHALPLARAIDPNQMYLLAYQYVFPSLAWAVAATVLFVIISQVKINVTNAYAGSLAWSNFFARLTYSHPGRVVWVVFNTFIALMLMELDLFQALGEVLGLYSNIAISWIMVVVADLVINKPLGLSPPGIEFRRAHLYDINPVGVGAMAIASGASVMAYLGWFGPEARAFSALIALVMALISAPLIAWATKGKYYIARPPQDASSAYCCICERKYEADDMAHCPAYQDAICSLCCTLDVRCHDLCKPDDARISVQWTQMIRRFLPKPLWSHLENALGHYLLLMTLLAAGLALLLWMLYASEPAMSVDLQRSYLKIYVAMLIVISLVAWWLVLTRKSRQVAQEESNRQTHLLMQEIESHGVTDAQLQSAMHKVELANQAKNRYITAISHELRTPLNSILGYAQILDGDLAIPPHRRQAMNVIRRSGEHLLSVIENTLDIAHIEGGKLALEIKPLDFNDFLKQIVEMFQPQALQQGLYFRFEPQGDLPAVVRADEKRMRQILINILGNALKFTVSGGVLLRVRYAREMATFELEDSGPGMSAEEIENVFEPFVRGKAANQTSGSGLGLTISRMLADVMGGQIMVDSSPGVGSTFKVRLFLPQVYAPMAAARSRIHPLGYSGERRRILIVDNERVDRELLISILAPLGFVLEQAASGQECLKKLRYFQPHLIFMDLAMPGIDGWETIRRIHQAQVSSAHIAIITANAYDKGLENDCGIMPQDFILKPVNMRDLLDWIGQRLGLQWIEAEADARLPATMPALNPLVWPSAEHLQALIELVDMGYLRGILKKLEEIEAIDPAYAAFTAVVRGRTQVFQFDAVRQFLEQSPHA